MAAAGTAAVDAYSASLPSLQGRSGRQTMQALMAGGGAGLALESIAEHYQRAMLFMDRHHAELSDEHLAVLAGWQAIAVGAGARTAAAVAAQCMLVMELNRVQRWPGAESLADAKECLDFASAAWCRLFCRLHGGELLLEALLLHVEALEQGEKQAEPAALAALQALHSLVSGAVGMETCLSLPKFIPAVCLALDEDLLACSEVALQLLATVLLYNGKGYAAVVHTLLGEQVPAVERPAIGDGVVVEGLEGGLHYLSYTARLHRNLCMLLLRLMQGGRSSSIDGTDALDFELADHAIRLLTIALSSPEAALGLRRRLADAVLAVGLLKVMADLSTWDNAALSLDVDRLKVAVHAKKQAAAVAVLDTRRATNIGIRIARLSAPWQRVAAAVAALDPQQLLRSADDISAVRECVPRADELKLLRSFLEAGGQPSSLSEAEKFAWELGQVPRLASRLRCLLLKHEAPSQLKAAVTTLECYLAAQRELRNFLNHGSRLGGVAGFRLKNLNKLADTRSLDGKETLLSWIARQLVSATPPLAVLRTELPHVASPQLRVAVDEAGSALASVEQGLADVRCELQYSSSEMCGVAGGSGAALQAMVSDLETQLEAAKRLLQECRDGFAVMAAFFGESASAMAALEQELWLPLQAFVGSFSDAQVAVLQQQKEEADRQRRQLDRTSSSSGRGRPTGPSLREQQAADKAGGDRT
ncbi:hypothetical protein CHLNCDRAFT_134639 [Chlorella variabilis]|uniref:Formin-like protein n=1 Tax=Chlorella variabilis TaxID=554065 RepID=E1ZGE8_CHLVA|nr:hypothetical protein CHLNCDRAFT_134639 [Chlorella variabilis]EFN54922.1 hypothetical protein CHLNCDRAFT_134639 [Chlorella variabilis]|eukprot:XP_005847024.1 hypothetical protein CHLNCDRAFT_134639 [Chlorella variabilis]